MEHGGSQVPGLSHMNRVLVLTLLSLAGAGASAQRPLVEWALKTKSGAAVATYATQAQCLAAAKDFSFPEAHDCEWRALGRPEADAAVVPPAAPRATPPVAGGYMPQIDTTKIPAAQPGHSTARRQAAPGPFRNGDLQGPTRDEIGAVRMGCTFSHMSFNDPLVYPGQPGASHLHTFVGNTGTDQNSTAEALASSGNSTCAGGTLNRSSYWFPTMIDTTDGTPLAPNGFLVYYKTGYGGVKPAAVQPVPAGLRFISGNAAATAPAEATGVGRYSCVGGTGPGVGWQRSIPTTCKAGQSLIMEVHFPQCWDGKNLSSPDNKSHMAEATGSGCPSSHPVALPAISYEIYYDVTAANVTRMPKWRLSSDNYPTTRPGGYSAHGDYVLGWDDATMKTFIKLCDQAAYDCHTNLLGDGTWLY